MKVSELILFLKALPQDSDVMFEHNGEYCSFAYAEVKHDIHFIGHDDDGVELKKKKIETGEPTSYLYIES